MKNETIALLKLTEQPYDEYNHILPVIKSKMDDKQVATFERVLAEELPLTTARRAYRTAIKVALDEPKVLREHKEAEVQNRKKS